MNPGEVISEYLVRLSADIDNNSFNSATTSLKQLEGILHNIKGFAVPAAVVTGLAAVAKQTVGIIKGVADTDMQYQKLATQMWTTTETAKALNVAMKTMGASEQDIAWVPELREQFFRLRAEMNELATPEDAGEQLRYIRSIGYEIQSLQVKLRMLKEWITYYLIKYLDPFIRQFKEFIESMNRGLGNRMPEIAKKIAEILSRMLSIGISAFQVICSVFGAVVDFVESLPTLVKKWAAIFAVVGAAIMSGPFGLMIMAIGGALLLIQDFVYYMNGWNSSKTLAPVWQKLLDLSNNSTITDIKNLIIRALYEVSSALQWMYSNVLTPVLQMIKNIVLWTVQGIDWESIKATWGGALLSLSDGFGKLYKDAKTFFKYLFGVTDKKTENGIKGFFNSIGKVITIVIRTLGVMAFILGRVADALDALIHKDFTRAAQIFGDMAKDVASGKAWDGTANATGVGSGEVSTDEKFKSGRASTMMADFMGNGFTREGSAVMVARAMHESQLKPGAIYGDPDNTTYAKTVDKDTFIKDEVAFGLFQWKDYRRKAALWDLHEKTGLPLDSYQLQMMFALMELNGQLYNGYYKPAGDEMRTPGSIRNKAYQFTADFEGASGQGEEETIENANMIYKLGDPSYQSTYGYSNMIGNGLVSMGPQLYGNYNNNSNSTNIGSITINAPGITQTGEQLAGDLTRTLQARTGSNLGGGVV